jgi:uncharacterized protein with NRDE domain
MCLIALSLGEHPRYPLIIAANRDEAFDRPTEPLSAWTVESGSGPGTVIYSGRDSQAGGTWMGFAANGRYAMLTNVRRPKTPQQPSQSRGLLVSGWLASTLPVQAYCAQLAGQSYEGFNLLVGDIRSGQLHYLSNNAPAQGDNMPKQEVAGVFINKFATDLIAKELSTPAHHHLSNASLDTPWPKAVALSQGLQNLLGSQSVAFDIQRILLGLLSSTQRYPDDSLPATGVPLELERALSSCFVRMGAPGQTLSRYGTRTSTVALWDAQAQQLNLIERTWSAHASWPQSTDVRLSKRWPE